MNQSNGNPKKMGRPTKYTPDLPQKLIDFFDIDLDTVRSKEIVVKDQIQVINEVKPNRLPTVEGFCKELQISKRTFHDWVERYPDFSHALGKAKQMQMNHLIQHTLEGSYNANFAKFLAQNISEYREKHEVKAEIEVSKIEIDVDDSKL